MKEINQSFLVPFNLLEKQLKTGFSIVMDQSNISSSCSNVSSDGCLNVDTSNNLNDVPFDDNEGSDMDFDEGDAGSVILNSGDAQDYLEGNEEELASVSSLLDSESDIVALNVDTQDVLEGNEEELASVSSLLDSVISSGSVEVIVLEDDDEAMVDVDQVSISHSQLSAIEGANAQFEAEAAVQENINLLEAAELRRNSEQVFPPAPVSVASTDSSIQLTPLQEFNFRITIDAIRLREERREAEEIQAFLDEQELSVDQCTGYGIRQGHLDFIRDIEGLLPKIPSLQLTFNWLTNSENNFNISI